MTLGCIVLAHKGPEQTARLIGALAHPDVRLYLHVDRRADFHPFGEALAATGVGGVTLLERRSTRWGGIELVDVALEGLSRAARDGCDYFALVSGQDFPLRPIDEIVGFADAAGSRSYLAWWSLPAERWRFEGRDRTDFYSYTVLGRRETCIPRGEDTSTLSFKGRTLNQALRLRSALKPARHHPSYARPVAGSQWWNLSRAAVDHVLRFLDEHPDYRGYHEHTVCPDELFFQTILVGTGFAEAHEVVDDSLRFMRWPEGANGPRTLTIDDLPAMLESSDLFARKFDATADAGVLDRLEGRLRA